MSDMAIAIKRKRSELLKERDELRDRIRSQKRSNYRMKRTVAGIWLANAFGIVALLFLNGYVDFLF
jgi:hypothetical protein